MSRPGRAGLVLEDESMSSPRSRHCCSRHQPRLESFAVKTEKKWQFFLRGCKNKSLILPSKRPEAVWRKSCLKYKASAACCTWVELIRTLICKNVLSLFTFNWCILRICWPASLQYSKQAKEKFVRFDQFIVHLWHTLDIVAEFWCFSVFNRSIFGMFCLADDS